MVQQEGTGQKVNCGTRKMASSSLLMADCLDKMHVQARESRPCLRLAGFDGEWMLGTGKSVFEVINDRGHPELPVLSATQEQGMIIRDDAVMKIAHNTENEATYKRVCPGQFVIHLRSFQGGFAHSTVTGIASPAYTIMKFKNPSLHGDLFWKYVFASKRFIKKLELIAYGIRDGRSIGFRDFAELEFRFPAEKEQEAIGKFFGDLDYSIDLQAKKIEKLRHVRTEFLDKMFVKERQLRPVLRLPGFNGNWIKVDLKDCFSTCGYKAHLALAEKDGRYPVIQQGDNPVAGYSNANQPFMDFENVVVFGDHTLSLYKPECPFFVATDGVRILKVTSLNRDFFYCFLSTYKPVQQGYKRHFSILIEQEGYIPPTRAEQEAIGRFFEDLDKAIDLQKKKVEKLRQIKAGCLERMFIQ